MQTAFEQIFGWRHGMPAVELGKTVNVMTLKLVALWCVLLPLRDGVSVCRRKHGAHFSVF